MSWVTEKISRTDPRAIYVLVALGVVVPMLFPQFILPVNVTTPVQSLFDEVDKLPEGSPVFLSLDFDPASDPEMSPIAIAFLKHCFRKKLEVTGMTLWPQGVTLAYENMRKASRHGYREIVRDGDGNPVRGDSGEPEVRWKEVDAREYRDWVFLGAQPGG